MDEKVGARVGFFQAETKPEPSTGSEIKVAHRGVLKRLTLVIL